MRVKVHVVRTNRPHWGSYSGINQFLNYVDAGKFELAVHLTSDGDQDFPVRSPAVRKWLRNFVQRKGMKYYKLSDFTTEIKTLGRCCKSYVDVVHYIDGEHAAQFLPQVLKRFGFRTKTMATYHQPPDLLASLVRRDVIAKLDYVSVVAPEQLPFFADLLPPERVGLILHGIDCDFFKPGARPEDDTFRCITVGHWLRDFDLVRQVAERLRAHKEIEFHVVVSNRTGPRSTGLEGLPAVTLYRDHVEDPQFVRLYQQSDVLLLPLKSSTANNAVLEGIACGLPVISTALPSLRAYLPGKEAILIEENRPDDFIEAILYLQGHPDHRRMMAQEARKRAEDLDWRRIAPQYEALYSKLATR